MRLVVLSGLLAAPACGAELRIDLRPRVEAASGPLHMGQLARLASDDLSLLRAVADWPLGRPAVSARSQSVQRSDIEASLRRLPQLAGTAVQWSGALACDIESATALVTGEAVARAALGAVPGPARLTRPPRDVRVTSGEVTLTARASMLPAASRRQLVWVEIRSGGQVVREVAVSIERLEADPQAHVAVAPMASPTRSAPEVPRRGASPDARAPAVERGHSATLRAGTGLVVAERRVEVLQDGQAGDRVLVRSASAPAPLSARVIGPELLELDR
ncbi:MULTISPECIES: hypothetical protein [Ramlibacter]|uniref:Flagella basal body P-ring formation protein FlgA C-terminal domain-containing protein n=1 Tax=Ramlibacter pinisoli TaxID=2682844 RepID=A0A6N8IT47_9BURK|nr:MULTISPECIES: hypothetical protein [Ramlibacter]MBA2964790.1 hypothetical protein [Ramlibacter sp. CGMCC 1.13660]MVQ29755.1 hypothetical protein [Ramlibacter pinisoli]